MWKHQSQHHTVTDIRVATAGSQSLAWVVPLPKLDSQWPVTLTHFSPAPQILQIHLTQQMVYSTHRIYFRSVIGSDWQSERNLRLRHRILWCSYYWYAQISDPTVKLSDNDIFKSAIWNYSYHWYAAMAHVMVKFEFCTSLIWTDCWITTDVIDTVPSSYPQSVLAR